MGAPSSVLRSMQSISILNGLCLLYEGNSLHDVWTMITELWGKAGGERKRTFQRIGSAVLHHSKSIGNDDGRYSHEADAYFKRMEFTGSSDRPFWWCHPKETFIHCKEGDRWFPFLPPAHPSSALSSVNLALISFFSSFSNHQRPTRAF